jgi:hypothetical protein
MNGDSLAPQLSSVFDRAQRWCIMAAAAAGIACLAGAFLWTDQFFRSWLMAWLLFLGLALGSMSIEMLHFLTGGRWGFVIRPPMEAAARTLPVLVILFLPVLLGMYHLYPWTDTAVVASDAVLQHKRPYLNVPFFLVRTAIYFTVWIGGTVLMTRWSAQQNDVRKYRAIRSLSAVGLILYVFTMTFAALDWAQSLDPHWYSTMWGFLFVIGQGLTAMSFLICILIVLSRYPPLNTVITEKHLHALGKLLLMFVMMWAYFSFSQLLIIWAGNLKEEVTWYVHRLKTDWQWVGLALVVLQFLLPFFMLLSRSLKRHASSLFVIAALVLVMRQVDLFWLVMPNVFEHGFHLHVLDIAAPVAIGGVWLVAFLWILRRRPLLPVNDPDFLEAPSHGD